MSTSRAKAFVLITSGCELSDYLQQHEAITKAHRVKLLGKYFHSSAHPDRSFSTAAERCRPSSRDTPCPMAARLSSTELSGFGGENTTDWRRSKSNSENAENRRKHYKNEKKKPQNWKF